MQYYDIGNIGKGDTMDDRRRRFIEEYLTDLNATQACIRAGYSPHGAKVTGSRLLSDANVKREIDKAMDKRSEELDFTGKDVMRALWLNHKTAFSAGDIGQSTRALELCGKHFANFTDRVSTGPDVFNVEIIIPNRDPKGTD